jgi:hypothetical protein
MPGRAYNRSNDGAELLTRRINGRKADQKQKADDAERKARKERRKKERKEKERLERKEKRRQEKKAKRRESRK